MKVNCWRGNIHDRGFTRKNKNICAVGMEDDMELIWE